MIKIERPTNYNTIQRKIILDYIASLNGSHVTANQIIKYFQSENTSIGRATVYRHLDKLVENGEVRKYNIDGISGACFQYIKHDEACLEHFHLKCEGCGELFHLQCVVMNEIQQHILEEHSFQINNMKTVLYGQCDSCVQNK